MIIISSKHPSASFPARREKVVHIWYNLGQGILGKVGLEGKDVTFHIHLAKALGDLCQAARSDSQMQFKGTKNKSTNQTAPGGDTGSPDEAIITALPMCSTERTPTPPHTQILAGKQYWSHIADEVNEPLGGTWVISGAA